MKPKHQKQVEANERQAACDLISDQDKLKMLPLKGNSAKQVKKLKRKIANAKK